MNNPINLDKLRASEFKGEFEQSKKKPNISDEHIKEMFYAAKDKWYTTEKLKELIGEVITVTVNDEKRSPINTRYLKRMTELTGERWRQRTGKTTDGKRMVMFYTTGKLK